jgi:monofunctional biosynthetic peptidoglycan transglycosylase
MTDPTRPDPVDPAAPFSGAPIRRGRVATTLPARETRAIPARPARHRSLFRRIVTIIVKTVLWFLLISILWVLAYRFIAPPITFTMVGDMLGGHSVTKAWMPISRIDPNMARAAIAGEDSRFCTHSGFDMRAIEQAYQRNAKGGRIRGGSTISQQTAKNVFLIQGGGYPRKALEAYFTVLIEQLWGKKRIMEVYLNVAETGIGTYGVNAGSIRYFNHDASRMTPAEAGRIAAVLPLPKKRAAIAPRGFTKRHGNSISRWVGVVRNDGLDACLR